MGETDNITIDTEAAGPGQPTSAKDTSTTTDPGAGAGAGAGAGTQPKPKRTRKKPVVGADLVAQQPEIVTVNIPESAPEAPKRSHKKKPAAAPDLSQLENNIEFVAAAGFGMVGLATKQPDIWAIRPDELTQISKPAARLVERAGQLETTNKYADYALLLGALAMVVIPRLILTKTMSAPPQREVIKADAGANERSIRDTNGQAARPISNDSQNPFNALYEVN
jgi:hypothetical protein